MTNKEAKETLLCLYDAVDEEGVIDPHEWYKGIQDNIRESLFMAIEALEQEPSAEHQETVTEFADRCRECGKRYTKRQTGHWITTRTFMHDGEYYCDKCKCDAPNNEKWDYCPNCGAKMEVGENG